MGTTVILRLLFIVVPIMSQRMIAKMSHVQPEMAQFRKRMADAKAENNNLLTYQALIEQQTFLKSRGIHQGRQLIIQIANGAVFMTQFFALKKMAAVNYPGFDTGGTLWFPSLTATDPYYILPVVSALTMHIILKVGIEFGSSASTMSPLMRMGMVYAIPTVVLFASTQFSSAICIYWCTSNAMSLLYAIALRTKPARKLFNIPNTIPTDKSTTKNVLAETYENYKSKRGAPPSIRSLKEKDAKQFRDAGKAKPYRIPEAD